MPQDKVFSVTEITRDIKRVITSSFGALWIEGELSGYKRHTSGHHYFTLKDSGAQLPCAMWRLYSSRLTFAPIDGMKVQAWGNLDVYEPTGRYQFMVMAMRPAGIGDLQRAFEALVQKLKAEGLFDLARKRPLPKYPERIGIVTSPDGAALQDMRTVAARRWPIAQLILAPVRVQGAGAAEEIATAIEAFNRCGGADVLVIGRGGGSLDDLWAFNEEVVARAIFHSRLPVVSAVGHEVDVTIADFVADVRAPTPSAAMELLLPDREEVAAGIAELNGRLNRWPRERVPYLRSQVARLAHHWALRQPVHLVQTAAQRLDDLHLRLDAEFARGWRERRSRLSHWLDLLTAYRPQAILERGYAMVRNARGQVVRDASDLVIGDVLSLTFAKGEADAEVRQIKA